MFIFSVQNCRNLNHKYSKYLYFLIFLEGKLSYNFPHFFGVFFYYFSHHSQALFCTLTSLNSIFEPINQVCVLGAINEPYEALCDVHMYVCMCLKVGVNYDQMVRVGVLFSGKYQNCHLVLKCYFWFFLVLFFVF